MLGFGDHPFCDGRKVVDLQSDPVQRALVEERRHVVPGVTDLFEVAKVVGGMTEHDQFLVLRRREQGIVVEADGLNLRFGQVPFGAQPGPDLRMIDAQGLLLGQEQGKGVLLAEADGVHVLVVEKLHDDDLADIVEQSGQMQEIPRELAGECHAAVVVDHAHRNAGADGMPGKFLVIESLYAGSRKHGQDAHRCGDIAHGVQAQPRDGRLQRFDAFPRAVQGGICHLQHVGHHRRIVFHNAGDLLAVGVGVGREILHLFKDGRERRQLLDGFELSKNELRVLLDDRFRLLVADG